MPDHQPHYKFIAVFDAGTLDDLPELHIRIGSTMIKVGGFSDTHDARVFWYNLKTVADKALKRIDYVEGEAEARKRYDEVCGNDDV